MPRYWKPKHKLSGPAYFYGRTDCLEANTEVYVYDGELKKKKIKDLPDRFNVLSYHFHNKKRRIKPAIKIDSGIKECYEIELENGERIIASGEHILFNENGKEIKVKDLKVGDDLLCQTKLPRKDLLGKNNPSNRLEVKEKLREIAIGNNHGKDTNHSEEMRREFSLFNAVKRPEVRKKQLLGIKKNGEKWRREGKFAGVNNPAFRHGKMVGQKENRRNYLQVAKDNYEWKCFYCNKTETSDNFDLVVHHVDQNNLNNNPDNLMILCQGCHARIHKIKNAKIIAN